jgi:predicted ArsR family transcriptional regulator
MSHSTILSEKTNEIRSVDRDLLVTMRQLTSGQNAGTQDTGTQDTGTQDTGTQDAGVRIAALQADSVGVGDLTDSLGVTATAVRQRIDRLLAMGLIDREKVSAGRGRPTFRYRLTVAGHRSVGANATSLADAMWREILELDDSEAREQLLAGIATRLGKQYAADVRAVSAEVEGESFDARMQRLSELLTSRQVITHITQRDTQSGELPVLDIGACPYPTLTDVSDDRSMCRLEEQMFSEALGQKVELSSCRLDGDSCCQFSPVEGSPVESSLAESATSETTK